MATFDEAMEWHKGAVRVRATGAWSYQYTQAILAELDHAIALLHELHPDPMELALFLEKHEKSPYGP